MGSDDAASSASQASGEASPAVERILVGRYRLGPTLGTGAYTKSFDAVDLADDTPVVVKMLPSQFGASASFMERFSTDLQVASELDHPNIARLLNYGVEQVGAKAYPFLVTEQFAGGSLRGMLDRGRQLSASQVLLVGLDVCRGLAYAHARGLIHGAVTPANLLFGLDRKVRIADFGISRLLGDIRWANPGRIDIDSARYASPEHALGLPLDQSSDVYSLCLTLVESVTGQVPFAADTAVSTLSARLDKLMPVSADLGALASVLERAGRPAAEDRFTAVELGKALVAAAGNMPRPEPIALIGLGRFGDATATLPVLGADPQAVPDESSADPDITGSLVATQGAAPRVLDESDQMALLAQLPDSTADVVFEPLPVIESAGIPAPFELAPFETAPFETATPWSDPNAAATYDTYESSETSEASGAYETAHAYETYESYETSETYGAESTQQYAGYDEPSEQEHTDYGYAGGQTGTVAGEVAAAWMPEPQPVRRTATIETVEGDDDVLNIDRRSLVRYLAAALALVAAAALGVVAFRWLSTPSHDVPNLIGASEAEAANIVASNGWTLDVRRARDDTQPQGSVVSTDPAAGEGLKEGATITLVVSDGPTLSVLPDVTNLPIDEARSALTAAGLVMREAQTVVSDTVLEGSIISWTVAEQPTLAAGSQVPKGTTVDVVVSAGSATRSVPNIVGAALDEARAQLESAGLVAGEVAEQRSATVPAGSVISTDPPVGSTVAAASAVNLTVSTGP